MRFVVARRLGGRGEGLGNEILSWSKGYIASEVLKAKLIGPSWGLNKRKYYRNFETSRLDFVLEDSLAHLAPYHFTEEDFLDSGERDFGRAIASWATRGGLMSRSSFIVVVGGMYGGYTSIRAARPFLWSKLLGSRDALRNIYEVSSALDPRKLFVAVHMRFGGDFFPVAEGQSPKGKFNLRLPGSWYLAACATLREALGDGIQFHFFTDRGGPEFDQAIQTFNPGQKRQKGLTECSDLALMAMADLRICSVSSYSLVASFLADGPYLWYEPQLNLNNDLYNMWGHEPAQSRLGSPTRDAVTAMQALQPDAVDAAMFKGWPVGESGTIPPALLGSLSDRLNAKFPEGNLLEYGCIPVSLTR
jgi:hypothetical protein